MRINNPILWTLIFLALTAAMVAQAQDTDSQNLLIKNVHINNSGAQAGADLANIWIRDGVLDIVSKDQVTANDRANILDAGGGYLLGRLSVGAPPKFMILDEDPVADIMVLLDTEAHVVFAIDDGEVLINQLVDAAPESSMSDGDKERWLAYDLPPFALPNSISSEKWNTWKSKWVNGVFISAVALDRQWISQDDDSIAQFGDLASERERGSIRGWRFGAAGTINFEKPWIYNIAGAWNSFDRGFDSADGSPSEFSFFDFAVDIPVGRKTTLRVGKQKEPINMDRSMSMIAIASQERYAAGDAMFPSRNVGVTLFGTAANQRVAWAAGLFNDWLIEGENLDESATQTIGRVTWLPFVSADESNLVHVGLGVRHTNAKQGLAYGARPETGNMPRFVDTDIFDAESSTLYNWEFGWRRGPLWLMAEYSDNHVDAPDAGDPNFTGYQISGTWSLTGEMRGYKNSRGVFDGLPIAQSVSQGGKGATELALRYSSIDLTEGLITGGEMDIATVQFNWWLTTSMAVSLNYRRTWTDRFDLEGEMDVFVARVMLILQ
jgi:phosphate-selective porin OprO/OprP